MLAKPAAQGTVVHCEIKATAMDACRMRDVCRLFRREESLTTPFHCFTGFSGQHHGNKFVVVTVLFPDPGRITAIPLGHPQYLHPHHTTKSKWSKSKCHRRLTSLSHPCFCRNLQRLDPSVQNPCPLVTTKSSGTTRREFPKLEQNAFPSSECPCKRSTTAF